MSQSSLPKFASSLYNKLAIVTNLQLRQTHSQKRTNLLIKPKLCLYIIIQAYPKSQLFAPTISRLPRFSLPKRADIYYNKSMNIQKILSGMRRACSELKLIDDADKIAVGVSPLFARTVRIARRNNRFGAWRRLFARAKILRLVERAV